MSRETRWGPRAHKSYLKYLSLLLNEMLTQLQNSSPKVLECVSQLKSDALRVLILTAKMIWS